MNAAKDQDFVDFYHTYYVPNNAVLSIAGDFKPEDAKKLIEQYDKKMKESSKYLKGRVGRIKRIPDIMIRGARLGTKQRQLICKCSILRLKI